MIEEVFIGGSSFIHRLDPRVKVIIAALYSIVVAICKSFQALIPAMGIALLVVLLSKLKLRELIKRVIVVNGFVLLLWLLLPFSVKGKPLYMLGPLVASREGLLYSVLITVKSNTIVLTLIALMATSSVFALGRALERLFVPSRLVMLLFFAYRYIHVIYLEHLRLAQAIKIRGFEPKNNLHTYKTYAYLIGMVLVKSHDRAERVKTAMLCRGFRGKFYDLSEFSLRWPDLWVMGLMLSAISFIAVMEWWT